MSDGWREARVKHLLATSPEARDMFDELMADLSVWCDASLGSYGSPSVQNDWIENIYKKWRKVEQEART